MAFITWSPLKKVVFTAKTTNDLTQQIWKQIISLRYFPRKYKIPKSISFWIDQASIYYLDATKIHWRSSGLLYYYSFLNLAKSLLVAKKVFSYNSLDKKSIYHGINSELQEISSIIDYKIIISPLKSRTEKDNVFANFYQIITGKEWPFNESITIILKDVIGYCNEIGEELQDLFNIEPRVVTVNSLIRSDKNSVWFEILTPSVQSTLITSQINNLQSVDLDDTSELDRNTWLNSHHKVAHSLVYYCFLRSKKYTLTSNTLNDATDKLISNISKSFRNYAIPVVNEAESESEWLFIPDIILNGIKLPWHPLLSEYLVAFSLSNILRYQPQILKDGTVDSFVMEGWCNQSAITALRYFLMQLTNPQVRLVKY